MNNHISKIKGVNNPAYDSTDRVAGQAQHVTGQHASALDCPLGQQVGQPVVATPRKRISHAELELSDSPPEPSRRRVRRSTSAPAA